MHVHAFFGENIGEPCTIWLCDSRAVAEAHARAWASSKLRALGVHARAESPVRDLLHELRGRGIYGRIEEHVVATAADVPA